MYFELFLLTQGFLGLVFGAGLLIDGALGIANYYKWSSLWVGTILVGFSTTLPEMIVSLVAVIKGYPHISIGNAFGSYIANIGMVLGLTALFYPLKFNKEMLKKELPVLTFSAILVALLVLDLRLDFIDGCVLIAALFLVLFLLYKNQTISPPEIIKSKKISIKYAFALFIIGSLVLWFSGEIMVRSAASIAKVFGMSEWLIGVTVVAIGTSLPELAASIISARKGHYDLAIGNVIGSNILGLLGVVAIPSLISPINLPKQVLYYDISTIFLSTIILWVVALGNSSMITKRSGFLLFLMFIAYLFVIL